MTTPDRDHASTQEPLLTALEWLRDGVVPVLVAVVDHEGSVPGTTGARMVVTPDSIAGTVGGGSAEHEMIELARAVDVAPRLVSYVHAAPSNDSLCSGQQRLAILPLAGRDLPALEQLREAIDSGACGTLELTSSGLAFRPGAAAPAVLEGNDANWRAAQPVGLLDTLTIVGGGHVALALSQVVATLPFRIAVLDDRPDLATLAANRHAHERRTVDYREIAEHVPQGAHSWAVIMTHGHRHDEEVLARLLDLELRFLGMLGSGAKVRSIFSNLEARGVARDRLARVRAPLGFPIGSHTPAEIAISIAAELVAVRNGRDPRSTSATLVASDPLR